MGSCRFSACLNTEEFISRIIFDTTGIPDFLKIYVPLLACGVLVSSLGTSAGWIYLLWRPATMLGLILQSALTFAVSSFVIGTCAWALISLTVTEVRYLPSVLWTLVALVTATGLGAV